ncbi:hypothetical protein [Kribbella sp. NPDC023855]|uniref:hypothetical protein n=1 Tax=Kribbella sp. NPDC023855 TaxID=3154698 RepID=UPI0033DF7950
MRGGRGIALNADESTEGEAQAGRIAVQQEPTQAAPKQPQQPADPATAPTSVGLAWRSWLDVERAPYLRWATLSGCP